MASWSSCTALTWKCSWALHRLGQFCGLSTQRVAYGWGAQYSSGTGKSCREPPSLAGTSRAFLIPPWRILCGELSPYGGPNMASLPARCEEPHFCCHSSQCLGWRRSWWLPHSLQPLQLLPPLLQFSWWRRCTCRGHPWLETSPPAHPWC